MPGRGVARGQLRASGMTVAEEEVRDALKEMEEPVGKADGNGEIKGLEGKRSKFRSPGFQLMRIEWRGDDRMVLDGAIDAVNKRLVAEFQDAYEVMNQVYELVRTPMRDAQGEVVRDKYGYIVWARKPDGSYDEDFTRLAHDKKEHLLFLVTTRIFDWEQRAQDAWGEAMFAKAMWEERFAIGFDAPMSGTVDDRTQAGRLEARDERYFAIFVTLYSRKAEAIVRSLQLLGQRLRDALTS